MEVQTVQFYPNRELKTQVSLTENTPPDASRKSFYVTPKDDERKFTVEEAKGVVFSELKYLNIILTNACNLSCKYCFEQHKKDYGRFDLPTLWKMYNFLLTVNNDDARLFQFFGGEPLAQKKLILDFCRTYRDELEKNKRSVRVSIVTNGLLLTPEFVKEYFDYDFTQIVISLDTDDAEHDQREVTQDGIDHIFDMIDLIPEDKKREHQVCIRSTMNEESVPRQPEYITRLYEHGIRNLIIHPLILSRENGKLNWTEEAWNQTHADILDALEKYPDMKITWAEGVGSKGNSNCLVGSDMITVDASGDFSGCYFFTNIKDAFGDVMLGNILNDEIYVDRYVKFQQQYLDALNMHEECRTCNLQGYCYQCPAGNLAVDGIPFRPDGMCKRIVRLFLDLRADLTKKAFFTKLNNIEKAVNEEGVKVLSKAVIHLMFKKITHKYLEIEHLNEHELILPDYRQALGYFHNLLVSDASSANLECFTGDNLIDLLTLIGQREVRMNAYEFYSFYCDKFGYAGAENYQYGGTSAEENYFIALLHLLILDNVQFKRKQEDDHATNRVLKL